MRICILWAVLLCMSCSDSRVTPKVAQENKTQTSLREPSLIILGTLQDAGSPQIACKKECCKDLFANPDPGRKVVSLGLIDPVDKKTFLFEATPDIGQQLNVLMKMAYPEAKEIPDGIFLTHAHIGHYAGLMYLGKEATNSDSVPVYAMPRMKRFIENNGPWDQLVSNGNIVLQELRDGEGVQLTSKIHVMPFLVPHRDEYSEVVGYKIEGPGKSVLFIPDINKWDVWEASIAEEVSKVDYAFLDACFYHAAEVDNRDISQIRHPFVIESMALFNDLPPEEKRKIHFIHFNHTNPLLNTASPEAGHVLDEGYHIAEFKQIFTL